MARIEDLMADAGGDWGGIEQLSVDTRIGYAQNFVLMEKTVNGEAGVYILPHVPQEHMASFLEWLASLPK
jgi:hypothetical protein